MRKRFAFVFVLAPLLLWIGGADAAPGVQCRFLEIEASRAGKKVDPALSALGKKLSRPPLSAWTSFKLLKEHNRSAAERATVSISLVPGSKASLLYHSLAKEAGKKDRIRLEFTLEGKDGKRRAKVMINLDSGDFYAVVGEPLKGGSQHILAVACST